MSSILIKKNHITSFKKNARIFPKMCKILIGVTVHKNKIVDDWKFQMLKSRETNNSIKQYPPGQNPERRVLCTCTPICPICPICPPRFSMEETDWEPWLYVGEEVERKLKEDRKPEAHVSRLSSSC